MMSTRLLRGAGAAVLFAALSCAQTGPGGHWEGAFTAGIGAANMAPGEGLQGFEAYARFLFSWLGTLLLAALLFHEVSDKMRTVAWGIQGLGLLFAGFPLRERPMRFAGLLLLLVCVLKLFVWDLRNLDMPFRVLSFIVLGLILIGVSFFYSRFRERISRYM